MSPSRYRDNDGDNAGFQTAFTAPPAGEASNEQQWQVDVAYTKSVIHTVEYEEQWGPAERIAFMCLQDTEFMRRCIRNNGWLKL